MKPRLTKKLKLLLSCEHGGKSLPKQWSGSLKIPKRVLHGHQGWDEGALRIARWLQGKLQIPLVSQRVSRLVIDCNRSPQHPRLFSKYSRKLSLPERQQILQCIYEPYRQRVIDEIQGGLNQGQRVLHISVHSFTPLWHGKRRTTDLGLLYDPGRRGEVRLVGQLLQDLKTQGPEWVFHRNQPYRGVADGLIPGMRKLFPPRDYWGLELEFNQALVSQASSQSLALQRALLRALKSTVGQTLTS